MPISNLIRYVELKQTIKLSKITETNPLAKYIWLTLLDNIKTENEKNLKSQNILHVLGYTAFSI